MEYLLLVVIISFAVYFTVIYFSQKAKFKRLNDTYGSDIALKLIRGQCWIGMYQDQAREARGLPTKSERQTLATKTKDTWVYGLKSRGTTLVFENNVLTKITEK